MTTFVDKQTTITALWLNSVDAIASDAELKAIAGLNSAADQVPYFTGVGTAALSTLTAFGRTLIAAASAVAARALLGLGSSALQTQTRYDVTDYGADPTGVADSTAAITAALAAGAGYDVYFPAGTYICDLVYPPANTRLVGAGITRSFIKRKAASTQGAVLYYLNVKGWQVLDLCVDGNKANETIGSYNILISGCGDWNIARVRSKDAKIQSSNWGVGIGITDGTNSADHTQSYVTRCRLDGNGTYGLIATRDWNLLIDGNIAYNNGVDGINLSDLTFPPNQDSQDHCRIAHNICFNNGAGGIGNGIGVAGAWDGGSTLAAALYGKFNTSSYIVVQGNDCHHNVSYGIAFQCFNGAISSNTCSDNGGSNAARGGMVANAWNTTIFGNLFHHNSGYGLDTGGSWGCSVTGNVFSANGTAGTSNALELGFNETVTGNVFEDNAGNAILVDGFSNYDINPGTAPYDTLIANNHIRLSGSNYGIVVDFGANNCVLRNNVVQGGTAGNDYVILTTHPVIQSGNVGNDGYEPQVTAANPLIIPDVGDTFLVSGTTDCADVRTRSFNAYFQKVVEIHLTNAGTGYDPLNPPAVTVDAGGGVTCTATAFVLNNGTLGYITITNHGTLYSSTPGVTIAAPSAGVTATATARVMGVSRSNFNSRTVRLQFISGPVKFNGNSGNTFLNQAGYTFHAADTLTLFGTSNVNWTEVGNRHARLIRAITTSDSATVYDELITIDATGGDVTLTLPTSAAYSGGFDSRPLRVKRIDASAHNVSIARASADTIDGATSLAILSRGAVDLIADGVTSWNVATSITDPLSLKIASDLSDIHSASTARTNLGLGTMATHAFGDCFDSTADLNLATGKVIKTNTVAMLGSDGTTTTLRDGAGGAQATAAAAGIGINNKVTAYNGATLVANGLPVIVAKYNSTGNTAAIGTTTILAVPTTGCYRISFAACCTQSPTTSATLGGTLGFQLIYTDPADSVAKTQLGQNSEKVAGSPLVTTAAVSRVAFANCKTGTNLQFNFDYTSVGATPMAYDMNILVEFMGPAT